MKVTDALTVYYENEEEFCGELDSILWGHFTEEALRSGRSLLIPMCSEGMIFYASKQKVDKFKIE